MELGCIVFGCILCCRLAWSWEACLVFVFNHNGTTGSYFFSWWINFWVYFVFIESQWYWLLMFFLESLILYDLTFVFVCYRITMELTFCFLDDLISVFALLLQSHNGILVFIAFLYNFTFVSVLLLSNCNGIGSYCLCLLCSYRITMVYWLWLFFLII
jgi:hypothetical protein